MHNIVISGYYGFDNLGDEAVLYSIINSLRSKKPNINITVLSNNPEKTSKVHGVSAVSRWKLSEIVKVIKDSDMLISGGGSLLQDVTSPKSLIYYLIVIVIAKILGKKVFFYAQGFGPVRRWWSKKLVKFVLDKIDCITLRDEKSADKLRNLGITKPPIIVTCDPVMGMDKSTISKKPGKQLLEEFEIDFEKPIVGFALRKWQNEDVFIPAVAGLVDQLIMEDIQPVFMSFHLPDDLEIAKKAIKQMKQKGAFLIDKPLEINEALSIISHMDLLVGMRLHSLIMATMLEIPVVGISYDPKVGSFLESIKNNSIFTTENVNKHELFEHVKLKLKTGQTTKERQMTIYFKERSDKTADLVFDYL